MIRKLVAALFVCFFTGSAYAENILSKTDVDQIFSLNRPAWNAHAQRMVHPRGWKTQLSHHETGITVMGFDPKSGMGMSIQPLYHNDEDPPDMVIIGSFYPKGSLPAFTPAFKLKIEREAQKDLGSDYEVTAAPADVSDWIGFELEVTRASIQ